MKNIFVMLVTVGVFSALTARANCLVQDNSGKILGVVQTKNDGRIVALNTLGWYFAEVGENKIPGAEHLYSTLFPSAALRPTPDGIQVIEMIPENHLFLEVKHRSVIVEKTGLQIGTVENNGSSECTRIEAGLGATVLYSELASPKY